ncbi:hypothetical protein [Bradyrhizobium japonicum]|uniref:hypothetical protein n=1 Tax=Bradyrhizobium japonicum TaxID=375 RepID=UPI001BA788A4|nr:hypothetical protein [Bradyrhizobium japonicum]MBR0915822.1 hypothetical protein [Bradyrhizobium japonicum]
MTEPVRPAINLTLQPDGVAAPAQRAALVCKEIVDLYFDALSKADLSMPPPEASKAFYRFRIGGYEMNTDQRRAVHENWLLARCFQDLMRGVLISLREAHLFIELLSTEHIQVKADTTLDNVLEPFRTRARSMKFPDLLASVNKRLDEPLIFADAYQSMQDARNCLEHADGQVGNRDVDDDGVLKLRFPRMKLFVMKDGEEVEIHQNFYVETETEIGFRLDVRERTFRLGERLTISAIDFDDIAFACHQFGTMLAQRLPKGRTPVSPQ